MSRISLLPTRPAFGFSKFAVSIASIYLTASLMIAAFSGCSGEKPPAKTDLLERETWDICFVQGKRVGVMRMAYFKTVEDGKLARRIESTMDISLKRFNQQTDQRIAYTSVETPDGQMIRFSSEMKTGPQAMHTTGRVAGKSLEVETLSQGKKTSETFLWSPDNGGFFAVEESLARKPMKPGERRTIHSLITGVNQVGTIELLARDMEQASLLTGKQKLLHIDALVIFPDGQQIEQTIWTDEKGETQKTHSPAMNMETFRVSKEQAAEKSEAAQLDLGLSTLVKVDRALKNARNAKRVVYRVSLQDGDPAKVFLVNPMQKIRAIDSHTAEITVYAVRPNNAGNADAPADPPTDDDRQPNNWIQSDDPKIIGLAQEALDKKDAVKINSGKEDVVKEDYSQEKDAWATVVALEKYVHGYIRQKDFSQAFATAAEVAQSREGDCTEHAVLLAALCRAKKIPARMAIGLVYLPSASAFGYHMWAEAYIGDKWISIDGTIAGGGIATDHLQIAVSNLKGASAYSSFLPVMQVVGQLKIEVVEEE